MFKSFEELQSFGKDSFESYVASANAMTKGLQAIAAEQADYARKVLEKGNEAFQKATTAKSFDQAVEAQQGFAKQAVESFSTQMNKVTALYTAAAEEACKPFESKFAQFGVKLAK